MLALPLPTRSKVQETQMTQTKRPRPLSQLQRQSPKKIPQPEVAASRAPMAVRLFRLLRRLVTKSPRS